MQLGFWSSYHYTYQQLKAAILVSFCPETSLGLELGMHATSKVFRCLEVRVLRTPCNEAQASNSNLEVNTKL